MGVDNRECQTRWRLCQIGNGAVFRDGHRFGDWLVLVPKHAALEEPDYWASAGELTSIRTLHVQTERLRGKLTFYFCSDTQQAPNAECPDCSCGS